MAARYGAQRQATLVETGNLGFIEYDGGYREAGLGYLRQAERELRERYGAGNVAAHSLRFRLAKGLVQQTPYPEAQATGGRLAIAPPTAGDSPPGRDTRLRPHRAPPRAL